MCHRGKLLLATIIFTTVSQLKVTAVSLRQQGNDSNVVDDMYTGCRSEAMEKFISSGLLTKELDQNEKFQKAWKANEACSKQIPGGIREHVVALSAYTDESQDFQNSFNEAVETMGVNIQTYTDGFHFKSLHFLLMDSMMLQKKNDCRTTFAFLDDDDEAPHQGETVRIRSFGTVYSTLQDLKRVEDLFERTVLNITTCFYVDLETHSCSKHKNGLLLSPAELFNVSAVEKVQTDDDDYTLVVLKHLKLHPEHDCYIFSGTPAVVSTRWLLSVFVALTFFMKF